MHCSDQTRGWLLPEVVFAYSISFMCKQLMYKVVQSYSSWQLSNFTLSSRSCPLQESRLQLGFLSIFCSPEPTCPFFMSLSLFPLLLGSFSSCPGEFWRKSYFPLCKKATPHFELSWEHFGFFPILSIITMNGLDFVFELGR